jgi:hypothetical protein
MKYLKIPALLLVLVSLSQCKKEDFQDANGTATISNEIILEYIDLFRDLTKQSTGFSPPVASRAFGYIGLTLYESVVGGMEGYRSLAGAVNGLPEMPTAPGIVHWGQVANAAMKRASELYFPTPPSRLNQSILYTAAKFKTHYLQEANENILDRSSAYGIAIAEAIFEYSKTDGGHEGYKSNFPAYTVPVGPGFWVPTGANATPLQPYWGNLRPFAKESIIKSQPIKHFEFSTDKNSNFYKEANEVYLTAKSLTEEQKIIARYWSDDAGALGGTPPGHSLAILRTVLAQEKADLALSAEALAKVGMAVSDAFVSCWRCKYVFNLMRPVTYIKQNMDPAWTSLLVTPPFPEYTSGHSVQSGATAKILTDLFGANYSFVDETHRHRTDINGAPRAFNSFDDFATEAAVSRLYGGIHYRQAIELGLTQGQKVGIEIGALPFRL